MFLLYKERKKFMEKAIDSWQAMASVYLAYRFPWMLELPSATTVKG